MKTFLSSVLPDTGIYFIATPNTNSGGFTHYPCHNLNEMIEEAVRLDQLELQVYFACASFSQKSYVDESGKTRYRTSKNAGWAKAFWLDIDCGADKAAAGKGYPNTEKAMQAVHQFTVSTGLPSPMIVLSGGGLHCYWPLVATITKENWKPIADKLKSLTQQQAIKLLADDSRTSDIASVLRPVGTHNWKPEHGGKEVVLKLDTPPVRFEQFNQIVNAAHDKYCDVQLKLVHSSEAKNLLVNEPETPENIQRVKSALSSIDPNCDRPIWRDVCFAVHSLSWSCSEQLARSWSKGDLQ